MKHAMSVRAELGVTSDDTFQVINVEKDDLGWTHVRLQQYFRGVRVANGALISHANARLPDHFAALFRIQGVHHAGFLAGENHIAPAVVTRYVAQQRRAAEIIIVAGIFGTQCAARATGNPVVAGSHLIRPEQAAGFQIESQDGVGSGQFNSVYELPLPM